MTIPRISGRSSFTTTSPMRLSPSEAQRVALVLLAADARPELGDLEPCHHAPVPAARARSSAAGATSSSGRPRRAATSSGRSRPFSAATVACTTLIGVVRAERLAQHVVDAGALEHGAHRATGDDTGTGRGRAEQDDARSGLTRDRVRDGALDARDLEEVLLGLLDALGDRRGHLLGLAVADADRAVAVADDHQGGEAEATTTLDDLGDAVDRDDALDEGGLLRHGTLAVATIATAPLVAAGAAAAALGCSHD